MGLSDKKEQQLKRMPIIQSRIKASRNGRFVIQQTIITNVKPIEYYKTILANTVKVTEEPLAEDELMVEEGSELLKRVKATA
ncbi:hypothetical protein JW826_00480 [Candidatus Woesearchaeota archaeon]|nr:hypothetical protein [Candidatus Woesearchaeota archaeon]